MYNHIFTLCSFLYKDTQLINLRNTLNNERIVAQSGWFTAHRFSSSYKKFVTLETHRKMKSLLIELEIPAIKKKEILRKLSTFGINSRTVYPDINGLCLHLNWKYEDEIIKGDSSG